MSSHRHRHKHHRRRTESDRRNMSKLNAIRSHESKTKNALDAGSVRRTKNTAPAAEAPAALNGDPPPLVEYDLMTGTVVSPLPAPNSQRPTRSSANKDAGSQRPVNPSSKRQKKKMKSNSHRANNTRDTFLNKHFNDSIKRRFKKKKKIRTDMTDKTEITKGDDNTKRSKRREKEKQQDSSSSSSDRTKDKKQPPASATNSKELATKPTNQKFADVNPAMIGVAAAVNADNEEKELVPVVGPITANTPYNHPDHRKADALSKQERKKKRKQKQEDDLENAPTVFESVDAPIRPTTDDMPIRKIETTKEFPKEGTGKATVCIDETPTAYGQVGDKKHDDDGRSAYLPVFPSYK